MSENPYQAPLEYSRPTRPQAPYSRWRIMFYLLASQTMAGLGGRFLADLARMPPGAAFAFAEVCVIATGILLAKNLRAQRSAIG